MSLKGRKKEEHTEPVRFLSELEQFCGGDKELYEALNHTMFLDPRKVETPMKEALETAKRFEKEKNMSRARLWYDIAGGLAIYEGNPKKVVELFTESARISGMEYPILKTAEKAVTKAQEYYKQYLKE